MGNWKTLLGFNPERHSVRTEIIAGITTFLTMSYILAVNPDILSVTGMDKGAVFTATALSSAVATMLIAFLAKLPFAQAPSMGINAFFAFTLVGAMGYSWQEALAAILIEGIIFIILTLVRVREKIVYCVPVSLRYAISAGIGMFIAFIGLKNSGIIVSNPATFVALGKFTAPAVLACIGIILSATLIIRKVKGALFYGIMICTIIGIPMGVTTIPDHFIPVSMPHSIDSTFLQFDFHRILNPDMLLTIFALVFMDIFNTIGTFFGAAAGTEMMNEDGSVKNINPAMLSDAIGTAFGAIVGTSTVTTYIESGSGIAEGGRTGLTAFVVGVFFFLALLFSPLFLLIPSAATSGALVIVGVLMLDALPKINLKDMSEALPAFITMLGMVLTYNIAEGMVLGMLSYTFVKVLAGKWKEVNIVLYIMCALFVLRYIYM